MNELFNDSIIRLEGLDDDTKKAVIEIHNKCQPLYEWGPLAVLGVGMTIYGLYDIGKMIYDAMQPDEQLNRHSNNNSSSELYNEYYTKSIEKASQVEGDVDEQIAAIVGGDTAEGNVAVSTTKNGYGDYSAKGFVINDDGTVNVTNDEVFWKSFSETTGLDKHMKPIPGMEATAKNTIDGLNGMNLDINKIEPALLLMEPDDIAATLNVNGSQGVMDRAERQMKKAKNSVVRHYAEAKVDASEYPDPSLGIVEGYKISSTNVQRKMRQGFYRNQAGEIAGIPQDEYGKLAAYLDEQRADKRAKLAQSNREVRIRRGEIPWGQLTDEERKLVTGERKLGEKPKELSEHPQEHVEEVSGIASK